MDIDSNTDILCTSNTHNEHNNISGNDTGSQNKHSYRTESGQNYLLYLIGLLCSCSMCINKNRCESVEPFG